MQICLEAIDHILVCRWLPTDDHYSETCRAQEKPRIFSRTPQIMTSSWYMTNFTLLNCGVNSGARDRRTIHTSRFYILVESKNVGIGCFLKISWQRRSLACQTQELLNTSFPQSPPYRTSDWVSVGGKCNSLGIFVMLLLK